MTDRYNALTVALERDIRDDDAETLIQAIQMLRGVLTVEGNVADPASWLAQHRARTELANKLWAVLYPKDADQ
jgi:hypothetical protein